MSDTNVIRGPRRYCPNCRGWRLVAGGGPGAIGFECNDCGAGIPQGEAYGRPGPPAGVAAVAAGIETGWDLGHPDNFAPPEDPPEPDDFDPGPEVDDEGGMSEIRSQMGNYGTEYLS